MFGVTPILKHHPSGAFSPYLSSTRDSFAVPVQVGDLAGPITPRVHRLSWRSHGDRRCLYGGQCFGSFAPLMGVPVSLAVYEVVRRRRSGLSLRGRRRALVSASASRSLKTGDVLHNIEQLSAAEFKQWLTLGAVPILAITKPGLEIAATQELKIRYGITAKTLGGRVCFAWDTSIAESPVLHCANRFVRVFAVAFADELREFRAQADIYQALQDFVEKEGRANAPRALTYSVASSNPLKFKAACRVNGPGAEQVAFGDGVDWGRLKQSVWQGVEQGTGWTPERRSSLANAVATAFFGRDHVALGVEDPRELDAGRFLWTDVRGLGMETALAGAMAAFAAEAAPDDSAGIVVDPACGRGTLLAAVARIWPDARVRLIGLDIDAHQIEICTSNLAACGLDTSGVHMCDGRRHGAVQDVAEGSADAVLSDLPCGDIYKEGADADSYIAFLGEAYRVLKPRGRCVLLTTKIKMLADAVSAHAGAWKHIAALTVRRTQLNMTESQLLVLERLG